MKLKKSNKKQVKDTAYAEVPFPVTEMNSIRIVVYDNDPLKPKSQHESGRFVIEVNAEFSTPQTNWKNQMQIQIRNRTSLIESIKHKIPTSAGNEYQDWYNNAYKEMQLFEIKHGRASHCKLGTQLTVDGSFGFRSVLGAAASLHWNDQDEPVVLLQMGEAIIKDNEVVIDGFCEEILLEDKRVHKGMVLWQETMEFE
jgi:hypothetical protein